MIAVRGILESSSLNKVYMQVLSDPFALETTLVLDSGFVILKLPLDNYRRCPVGRIGHSFFKDAHSTVFG